MRLHLGVIDQPYTAYAQRKRGRAKRGKKAPPPPKRAAGARTVTTSDVAGWLEDRYHIMEVFFEADGGVVDLLNESVQDAIDGLLMGAPTRGDPFLAGTSEIQARFKTFLSSGAIERMGIPDVPTQAALLGRSSRFKRGKNPKGRRPSFIDTGLYQASFIAWTD